MDQLKPTIKKDDPKSCGSSSDEINNTAGIGQDVLDAFQDMSWNLRNQEEYKKSSTNFFLLQDEASSSNYCSHTQKMIIAGQYTYASHEYKLIPQKNGGKEPLPYYVPGLNSKLVIYPKPSMLTINEHELLFKFYCRIKFKNPALDENELATFRGLLSKSHSEYEEFQRYVQYEWITQQYKRSFEIQPSVLEFINEWWNVRAKQCLALYPHAYHGKDHIPLMLNDPYNDHCVMDYIDVLMMRGKTFKMTIPSTKKRCDLISDISRLCRIKPISESEEQIILPVPPVSIDPNIVNMCINDGVMDVVITCSGIKAIVDVYNLKRDWILPVTVKGVLTANGEINKKIVIIDKCLPSSHMSVSDKKAWHAKIASKWVLIAQCNPNIFDKEEQLKETTTRDVVKETESTCHNRTLTEYDDIMSEDVEEFGIDITPSGANYKTASKQKPAGVDKDSNFEDGEIESVFADYMRSKQPRYMSRAEDHSYSQDFNHSNLNAKHKRPRNPHLVYKLWNLHKSKHFNMSKQEQRCLKILVRHRLDGNLVYYEGNKRILNYIYVSSKLEYQPEYGASKMSKSELVREYVDLFIRETNLCRVRSVGHTNELMLHEIKNLAEIKESLQQHQIETKRIFDPLYSVLTKLIDMPVGRYVLQHTPKMGAFATLQVESERLYSFNLAEHCDNLKEKDVNLPPAEIDRSILTRLHFREKIPPCLFRPHHNFKETPKNLPVIVPSRNMLRKRKKREKKLRESARDQWKH